jgi:hypothetical protein
MESQPICAECGATFPKPPASGGASGYATCPDGRRICYVCAAEHERLAMVSDGHAILYLTTVDVPDGGTHERRTATGWKRYVYRLGNWPGTAKFNILGRVHESYGYGFGRRYPVRTFRFIGPDGHVWSGRNAGDMDLARCRRTKATAAPAK